MANREIRNMLTIREMAKELKVTPETLRVWRREGRGPEYVKYGGVIRYFGDAELPHGNISIGPLL